MKRYSFLILLVISRVCFSQVYPYRVSLNSWRYSSLLEKQSCQIEKSFHAAFDFHDKFALVDDGKNLSLIDHCGDIKIKLPFENVRDVHNGIALFQKDGLWGGLDTNGKVVIQNKYEILTDFSGWCCIGKRNDKFFLVKLNGIEIPVLGIPDNSFNSVTRVKTAKGYSLINSDGVGVSKIFYDHIFDYSNGVAIVSKDGKYGSIDSIGDPIIPLAFDDIRPFYSDTSIAKMGNSFFLITKRGTKLKEIISSDEILTYNHGFLLCLKFSSDNLLGLKNLENEWVLDPVYKDINFTKNHIICAWDKSDFTKVYDYNLQNKLFGKYSYVEELDNGILRIYTGNNPLNIYTDINTKMGYYKNKWLLPIN